VLLRLNAIILFIRFFANTARTTLATRWRTMIRAILNGDLIFILNIVKRYASKLDSMQSIDNNLVISIAISFDYLHCCLDYFHR